MESILNAGLGIGVFMFLLLLFKKRKNRSDYLFLGWLAVTLGQITFYEITIYHFQIEGLWAIVCFALPLLGAPTLFLYILSLTGHRVSWKTLVLHLGIYVVYVLIFFILQQKEDLLLVAKNGIINPDEKPLWWLQYYAVPLAISAFVYCAWDLILLSRHRANILDYFSFEEKVNLKWVSYVVNSYFILFLATSFLIFGAVQFQLFPVEKAFTLVGICLSTMVIAFGFYGFRQTAIFTNTDLQKISRLSTNSTTTPNALYSKSGLTIEKIKNLANRLTEHMEIEKPFLNENLNLSLLAEKSEISQSHISQVINQHFQMHFYDFINRYRVEEAKKKLSSPDFDHLSVLGIAFDCGFKSKSSFNRYFKKYTGISPSEFKKNNTN